MSDAPRFEQRMSDADALMWHIEQDPILRSTITCVWMLDRPPVRARLDDRIERATRLIPRLRQRVVSNPLSLVPPRWEVDPHFDLSFHVRFLKAIRQGARRDVLDMAQVIAMQGFDRARPLWEFYVIDQLTDGGAAMIMKLHHSISDGVGLVRMTSSMVERYRDPDPDRTPKPMPPAPDAHVMSARERILDGIAHESARQVRRARRALGAMHEGITGAVRDPLGAVRRVSGTMASAGRLLAPVSEPLSPVLRGRSLSVRFDAITVPLAGLKAAGKLVEGTLNDAFVAAVAGGLRRYHEAHGAPVAALRMTMPINVRASDDDGAGGNRFVPARFPVPVDVLDPVARMRAIRRLVGRQRAEPALGLLDDVSSMLTRLPKPLYTALFGSMLKGVDFVTSNVPGPPIDVFMSGARIESIFGFGPLSGAAANVTLFSYRDQLGVAVNTDRAAVHDPDRFVDCLVQGFAEVIDAAA